MAASYGHLDCLKYAHENGCPWDKETCINAVEYDIVDCLTYAHKNGCVWDAEKIYEYAVETHSFNCLKYIHDNFYL